MSEDEKINSIMREVLLPFPSSNSKLEYTEKDVIEVAEKYSNHQNKSLKKQNQKLEKALSGILEAAHYKYTLMSTPANLAEKIKEAEQLLKSE